eukprot:13010517-Alexandrium_andersonii.AAC.1
MSASLVGSEMCIRDRLRPLRRSGRNVYQLNDILLSEVHQIPDFPCRGGCCLLYTSDAADDM